jgi:hypothetical protein
MRERNLRRGRHRRSERLSVKIPVQLVGVSETGQQILENAETLALSECGASILSKQKFEPEQEMMIRRADIRKEARVRVVGRIGDRPEGYVYAVEFTDPQAHLWEMEFPSTPEPDRTEDLIFLVCGCCQTSEAVQLGEPKLSDFEAAHGVLLYCSHCQSMTRWMQKLGEATTGGRQSGGNKPK